VLGGISMGATSVLMAAGDPELPSNVRGVVADCGFTDCGGEFAHVLRQMYRLPARPIMALTEPLCRKRLGFGFRDHSTERAVSRMSLPVLFFHGAMDALVPAYNSRRAFAACPALERLEGAIDLSQCADEDLSLALDWVSPLLRNTRRRLGRCVDCGDKAAPGSDLCSFCSTN